MDIDWREPSREADAWVERHVMGHDVFCLDVVPHYTADIADAWRVVEALARAGYWCQMRTPFGVGEYDDGYWCGFTPHLAGGWNGIPDDWTPAPTMPLAICAAACAWFDNTQRPTPPASAVSTPPRP